MTFQVTPTARDGLPSLPMSPFLRHLPFARRKPLPNCRDLRCPLTPVELEWRFRSSSTHRAMRGEGLMCAMRTGGVRISPCGSPRAELANHQVRPTEAGLMGWYGSPITFRVRGPYVRACDLHRHFGCLADAYRECLRSRRVTGPRSFDADGGCDKPVWPLANAYRRHEWARTRRVGRCAWDRAPGLSDRAREVRSDR